MRQSMRLAPLAVTLCLAGPLACATLSGERRPVPAEPVAPAVEPAPGPEVPAVVPPVPEPSGTRVVFYRGKRCEAPVRYQGRRVVSCAAEERKALFVAPDLSVTEQTLPDGPPRARYPFEIVGQWRHCGRQPALEGMPDVFARYEDPDIAECFLYRPFDRLALAAMPKRARLDDLEDLHPIFASAARALIAQARAEGIDVHVVSVIRPYSLRKVVKYVKVRSKGAHGGKRGVRKIKRVRTVRHTTLHAFGLAADLFYVRPGGRWSTVGAYRTQPVDRAAWNRMGEIGESLGLTWLGRNDAHEISHFEWHPGLPGMPKGEVLSRMNRILAAEGREALWQVFLRFDPRRKPIFHDLDDRGRD